MGTMAKPVAYREIEGLREVFAELDAAETKRDGIRALIASAEKAVANGQAERAALIAKIAAGDHGTPGASLAIENATREADSALTIYREALVPAEAAVKALEAEASTIEVEAWREHMDVFWAARKAADARLVEAIAQRDEAQRAADREWHIGRANHKEFRARIAAHWKKENRA